MTGRGWMVAGLLLLAVGLAALLVEGFAYVTREEVLDVGPLEVTTEREERIGIPPWVGAVLVGGGAILLVVGVSSESRRPD